MKVQQVTPGTRAAAADKQEAPAQPEHILELWDGRKVEMAKPKAAVSLRIFDMLGPEQGANGALNLAYRAMLHIRKIDGQDVHAPQGNAEMLALGDRLGDEGLDEVMEYYSQHFGRAARKVRPLSTTASEETSSGS